MGAAGEPPGKAYVSCLDCGMRFSYDTREMRMGKRMPRGDAALPHAGLETSRRAWPRVAAIVSVPLGILAGVLFHRRREK